MMRWTCVASALFVLGCTTGGGASDGAVTSTDAGMSLGDAGDPPVCLADSRGCLGRDVADCNSDGSAWTLREACTVDGEGCREGACVNLCQHATENESYEGCEFYAVDLDHGIDGPYDGSRQPFGVVVSNPGHVPADIVVERMDSGTVSEVTTANVGPGELAVLRLERREVDGSTEGGSNDGTHTALTSGAYRIRTTAPVIASQMSPVENRMTFSADASLLLPVPAAGTRYTVAGWPQTLDQHRAFLTIVGTQNATQVQVTLGPAVREVAAGGPLTAPAAPGDTVDVTLAPFDVLNLETNERGGDFTGTVVTSSEPVLVFSGTEAADVPFVEDPTGRQPAADHLEELLLPDSALSTLYVVPRFPDRSRAVNDALLFDTIEERSEADWVRIVAAADADVTTDLPPPDDRFNLSAGHFRTLRLEQDTVIRSTAPVAVLQLAGGQTTTTVPARYPGGDPAMLLVPPVAQWRSEYVVLTPDYYAFDFLMIAAGSRAQVRVDGEPAEDRCQRSELGDQHVVYRCTLSLPAIQGAPDFIISPGMQQDGTHRIEASEPVGVTVYGFDRFISYAYAGGMDARDLI